MTIVENNWWLTEAGEYVLGTLGGSERELFEKVLESDRAARAHVSFWEENFFSLEKLVHRTESSCVADPDIPERIWDNILVGIQQQNPATMNAEQRKTPERARVVARQPVSGLNNQVRTHTKDKIGQIQSRLNRSRYITAFSMAATLMMGAFLLNQIMPVRLLSALPTASTEDATDEATKEATDGIADYDVIAVLRDESGADLWAILAETNGAKIRSVALQPPEDTAQYSYQLWVVLPEDAGVQSVGLLPYGNGNARVFVLEDDVQQRRLNEGAAFAVSLEPVGGTTEPAPTGEVISVSEYIRISENDE